MKKKEILALIKATPNDADLGGKIRSLFNAKTLFKPKKQR